MIHIEPKEPGPGWDNWKKDAHEETQKLIDDANNGKKLKFKDRIWRNLKPFLENLFHKKCAYCEGIYEGGAWMDVEHFRPKGKVTVDHNPGNTVKITNPAGKEIDHPGYYWLAYDWRNLLLSCNKCNRGAGKMNQFPVAGIRSCCHEDSLEVEEPLLLNPYHEKHPGDHIKFALNGVISGRTEKGRETIKICNLNREELQTVRQREWEKVKMGLFFKLIGEDNRKLVTDDMEYSAYIRESLKSLVKKLEEDLEERI